MPEPHRPPPIAPVTGKAWWRGLGPSMQRPPPHEVARGTLGAVLGIVACALALQLVPGAQAQGLQMIAPLGATAVLVFAIPNSPLAQPWSAVVGNGVSALVASLVLMLFDGAVGAGLAVGAALVAMLALRALHPPGGAVALLIALQAQNGTPPDPGFALMPVAVLTAAIVVLGIVYDQHTGRRYPFRQPDEAPHPGAGARLALPTDELEALLAEYRQGPNLGAADLARLLAGAEAAAAAHRFDATTTADIMTSNPVTALPGTGLKEMAATFAAHGFKTLPIVTAQGRFAGLVSQGAVLAGFAGGRRSVTAQKLIGPAPRPVDPQTPVGLLLARLADSAEPVIPVTEGGRLVGIITRSDVLALLLRTTTAP